MRIGGIASGIDTEMIVKNLISAESGRVNRLFRQEQTLKWRQEAYLDVNRTMANFILKSRKDLGLSNLVNGTITQSSVNNLKWVKEATSSNSDLVAATANSNAMNGSYSVEVLSLAKEATFTSGDITSKLDTELKFTANDEFQIEVVSSSGTINRTFQVGPGQNEDIHSLITSINNSDLGVRAAYDTNLGKIMLSTKEAGSQTISILGLAGSIADTINTGSNSQAGTFASVDFNGSIISNLKSNNVTVFGINLNLKGTTTAPVTVNVSTNTEGIYDNIKTFIDSYNELLDGLNGKLNEKVNRSFQPLITEEKEAMTEKEIELWEEKAKSGLLRSDEVITRSLQTIRQDLYKEFSFGTIGHLSEIGITTGHYKDGGKLVIDEVKLKNAIENNTEAVMDVFFKAPASDITGEDRTKASGIIQRVNDGLVEGMKDIVNRSGAGNDATLLRSVQTNILIEFVTTQGSVSSIEKNLLNINSSIVKEEALLARKEERYWSQFTAMEKAMSEMQSQSQWLMGQLGMGGGN
ncbi:flagellar filament capping protein FliD [Alkaliphilus serpentinus]|uniref:Flagellar hook-associated protein 2 n=1 Tax=Alkaliphilus serpentinus TaxID=1482731 RepID=A0A833HQI2_9FIRM|nr:flagellar filament capping protein FliD [Alkaliphilus serpentinus]KAB3532049.1 flagellar filament capping protein FliD [Alkaliphilus serpentinus]